MNWSVGDDRIDRLVLLMNRSMSAVSESIDECWDGGNVHEKL